MYNYPIIRKWFNEYGLMKEFIIKDIIITFYKQQNGFKETNNIEYICGIIIKTNYTKFKKWVMFNELIQPKDCINCKIAPK